MQLSFIEKMIMSILRCGPIPRHVAVILDGNRRWAKGCGMAIDDGYSNALNNCQKHLQLFIDCGIEEVSVYAFSIENFKRTDTEIKPIMTCVERLLNQWIDTIDVLNEKGIRIRIHGQLDMLPEHLTKLMARIMVMTHENSHFVVNLCLAYTARMEIANAINEIKACVANGMITAADVTAPLVENFLSIDTAPDLLIRTSGESRLSDFLLWQTSHTVLKFTTKKWPEFSVWSLFGAIVFYQLNCAPALVAKKSCADYVADAVRRQLTSGGNSVDYRIAENSLRVNLVTHYLAMKRMNELLKMNE